jgi:hypothetical protein
MPTPWVWEKGLRRYRDTETGRFIGAKGMVDLRDRFVAAQKGRTAELAARLTSGEIDSAQWVKEMRQVVKETYIDQYVMAKGGRGQLTQADYGRIGAMVKEQYKFLQGFERDILNGKVKAGQIAVRAGLYVDSSTQSFERSRSESMGVPTLPQYPGDGATVCRTNCKCHWEIRERIGGWDCYWRLGPVKTEHCPDCLVNTETWNPLQVERA